MNASLIDYSSKYLSIHSNLFYENDELFNFYYLLTSFDERLQEWK